MTENVRGRRQAGVVQRKDLAMDDDELLVADESDDSMLSGPTMLVDGDTIMAKVTHAVKIDGEDSWFTYGATSRVLPGEAEEEAFYRLSATVNARVLDMVGMSMEEIEVRRQAFEEQANQNRRVRERGRQIVPRG